MKSEVTVTQNVQMSPLSISNTNNLRICTHGEYTHWVSIIRCSYEGSNLIPSEIMYFESNLKSLFTIATVWSYVSEWLSCCQTSDCRHHLTCFERGISGNAEARLKYVWCEAVWVETGKELGCGRWKSKGDVRVEYIVDLRRFQDTNSKVSLSKCDKSIQWIVVWISCFSRIRTHRTWPYEGVGDWRMTHKGEMTYSIMFQSEICVTMLIHSRRTNLSL